MNEQDRELLFIDLCGRLPYEVKVNVNSEYLSEELIKSGYDKPLVVYGVTADGSISFTLDKFLMEYSMPILSIKPYLFPLSSMTEEQKIECFKGTDIELDEHNEIWSTFPISNSDIVLTNLNNWLKVINWLNKNHFDYRGLIEKGLAIDARGLNIY